MIAPFVGRRLVIPVTLERANEEAEVVCYYHTGDPGCHTMRNGDPGWPPEPAEVEIEEVRRADGIVASARDLTDREVERVEELVYEAMEDDA